MTRGFVLAAAALAASGCTPEAPAPTGEPAANAASSVPAAGAVPPPGPAPASPAPAAAPARRCGWLHNPTPGNWWLVDRHGEWTLGAQGGYQAPGLDEMPDMSALDWEKTNGHYGYGCACLTVTVDAARKRVTRVSAATALPLDQCRADRALPGPLD